jgi:hypothetical protein
MPIYEYQNLKTGEIELHFNSVARRDCMPAHYRRLPPSGVGTCGLACPPTQSRSVMEGFKQLEDKIGTAALMKEAGPGWTPERVKKVWQKLEVKQHATKSTNEPVSKAA